MVESGWTSELREGDTVVIGDAQGAEVATIQIVAARNGRVRLRVVAPPDYPLRKLEAPRADPDPDPR